MVIRCSRDSDLGSHLWNLHYPKIHCHCLPLSDSRTHFMGKRFLRDDYLKVLELRSGSFCHISKTPCSSIIYEEPTNFLGSFLVSIVVLAVSFLIYIALWYKYCFCRFLYLFLPYRSFIHHSCYFQYILLSLDFHLLQNQSL